MAPEIWLMHSYNEKVDIWSIGVATYYMYFEMQFRLSGEYPFYGENTQQLLNKICHDELKFTPHIWDSISSRGILVIIKLKSY